MILRVALGGGEYDCPGCQSHPKCLERTRVNHFDHMYGILDDPGSSENQLVWLNGMAGVGKSAVAFTVPELNRRMSE